MTQKMMTRTEHKKRPAWMKDYRQTFQMRDSKRQIGYITNDGKCFVEQYHSREKYEQEKNYCHLWRVNGGNCHIIYTEG